MKTLTHDDVYGAINRGYETYVVNIDTSWNVDSHLYAFLVAHREAILAAVYKMRVAYEDDRAAALMVPAKWFDVTLRDQDIKFLGFKVVLCDVPTLIIGREVDL